LHGWTSDGASGVWLALSRGGGNCLERPGWARGSSRLARRAEERPIVFGAGIAARPRSLSVKAGGLPRTSVDGRRRRIVAGKPHPDCVSDDFDPGMHSLCAVRAQPHVLDAELAAARFAAKIEIQAEQLSLVTMTDSLAPAIRAFGFGGHNRLRLRADGSNLIAGACRESVLFDPYRSELAHRNVPCTAGWSPRCAARNRSPAHSLVSRQWPGFARPSCFCTSTRPRA
jgi:hypothetical protein